jgi:transposase
MLLDGPMDGAMFLAYIRTILVPELHPGDLVICDNLSSHKVSGVRESLEDCGAQLLHLPAYSPDLNPIELAFSKLKAFLRQRAKRTFAALQRATARSLDSFTPAQCSNFFRHARYATY